jgi:hypothetical protein
MFAGPGNPDSAGDELPIVKDFEPGKGYPEKQVNEVLARFHVDTATLRRELVGAKLMDREGGGGEYWRTKIRK